MRFQPFYAALFYTEDTDGRRALTQAFSNPGCTLYVYDSLSATLVVAVGTTHPESVGRTLQSIHRLARGGSLLGPVFSAAPNPPLGDICLLRHPLQDIPGHILNSISCSEKVFAFLDLTTSTAWLATSQLEDVYAGQVSGSTKGMARFGFRQHIVCSEARHGSQLKYDPLGSRVSELINQTVPGLREDIHEILSSCATRPAPYNFPDLRDMIDVIHHDEKLLERAMEESSEILGAAITRVQRHLQRINSLLRLIRSNLVDLAFPEQPLTGAVKFEDAASTNILFAARAVMDDLADRVTLRQDYTMTPLFDDDFYIDLSMLNMGSRLVLVGIPRNLRLRTGALPVLANAAAWLGQKHIRELSRKILYGEISCPHVVDLLSRFKIAIPLDDRQSVEDFENVLLAEDFLEMLMGDLVSVAVCGPAYVFALARFSTEGLSIGEGHGDLDKPTLKARIKLCLSFLADVGIDVPFRSNFIEEPHDVDLGNIGREVASALALPYTLAEHRASTEDIQRELRDGYLVSARPTVILNALWDGVARKSGYVNEISVMCSLMQWRPALRTESAEDSAGK